MEAQNSGHPVLNVVLSIIAIVTGGAGMNMEEITMADLDYIDKVMAIALKAISMVSFIVLITLNLGKLRDKFIKWFSPKKKQSGSK